MTEGNPLRHILSMAAFIATGLVFQSLYYLVDLYFVSRLGPAAIAGVGATANFNFLVLALTQLVTVGASTLIAQALGAANPARARAIFHQSLVLSVLAAVASLVLLIAAAHPIAAFFASTPEATSAGAAFLAAAAPSFAAMFPGALIQGALRAEGVVAPSMALQTGAVLLNIALAPVLISGWGTGLPLGAAGAGWATTIASLTALAASIVIFPLVQKGLTLRPATLAPDWRLWGRLVSIGLPVAGEFLTLFLVTATAYAALRRYGPDVQAGLGVGSRVMTSIFLPALAIGFATSPVVGQNYGARRRDRVLATFRAAALASTAIMLTLSLLCHLRPEWLTAPFAPNAATQDVAATFLRILSWNFVAAGLSLTASGVFQGLGITLPSFLASGSRLLTYVVPALLLVRLPATVPTDLFHLSVASNFIQAAVALWLLHRTFARHLPAPALADSPVPG